MSNTPMVKRNIIAVMAIILSVILILTCIPTIALANAAAPAENSYGSGVVFEKFNEVKVLSEVLNIKFGSDRKAQVEANYKMKNLTDKPLTVNTMFLSPIAEGMLSIDGYEQEDASSDFSVKQNGVDIEYSEELFRADRNSDIKVEDWQYIVENGEEVYQNAITVSAVSYDMEFAPNEEIDLSVSYSYRLGGSVSYVTQFEFLYYLTPAKYWDSFSDLTINLTLEDEHPRLDKKQTSVDFKKVGDNTYQFKSDTLPEDELSIVALEPWLNVVKYNLFNPFSIVLIWIPLLGVVIIIVVLILIIRHVRKKKRLKDSEEKADIKGAEEIKDEEQIEEEGKKGDYLSKEE